MTEPITIRNCVLAFKCTAKWHELTPTNDDNINFCEDCQREVHFCEDDDELAYAVRLNRCIAIYRESDSTDAYSEDNFLLGVPRVIKPKNT